MCPRILTHCEYFRSLGVGLLIPAMPCRRRQQQQQQQRLRLKSPPLHLGSRASTLVLPNLQKTIHVFVLVALAAMSHTDAHGKRLTIWGTAQNAL